MTAYLLPQDAQQVPPVCHCALCGGRLYRDDLLYLIDEQVLCPDCLGALQSPEYFCLSPPVYRPVSCGVASAVDRAALSPT